MYKIYIIKNKINNKVYIGQTKRTLKVRFNGHKTKSKDDSKSAIHNAMRLYGVENFFIELVCECSTIEESNEKEIQYIKKFNSISPHGYNILEGGKSFPKFFGPCSDEHKNKLKISHQNHCKPIIQFNIENGEFVKEWESGKELKRNGFNRANIICLCKSSKGFGYIYGYGWSYKKTYETITDKTTIASKYYNPHGKIVNCFDKNGSLIKTYHKITDAAKELACDPSSILDCLKGRTKTCKGFVWHYAV
jgi:group I intron endonuclease